MSKQLTRRGLFGLLRPRPRTNASGHASAHASGSAGARFSLEDFYRRRAADGSARAPVPARTPRADLDARNIATTKVGVPDLVSQRRKS